GRDHRLGQASWVLMEACFSNPTPPPLAKQWEALAQREWKQHLCSWRAEPGCQYGSAQAYGPLSLVKRPPPSQRRQRYHPSRICPHTLHGSSEAPLDTHGEL